MTEHPYAVARDVLLDRIAELEHEIHQIEHAISVLDHPSSSPPDLELVSPLEEDPTPPHGIERPPTVISARTWEPVECPVCGRECHPNGLGPHMRKHQADEIETVGDVAPFDPDRARAAAADAAYPGR